MPEFLKRLTPLQATTLLIVATAMLRLLAAGRVGLSVDEAHYALYGFYLDWSYFDHPPMIGWLQSLVLPFAASDLSMRLWPVLLFAATSAVLFRVTLLLFPGETPWLGFISVALLNSGVIFQLIGMAMLPDTPLLLLGLLFVWVLHTTVIAGRARYWLVLGVLLGLAALSKYTSITLLATLLLALTLGKQWRQLRTPWPWLAIVMGGVLIFPVLYWNFQHDWISFLYQLHHGAGKSDWQWKRFAASEAAQMLTYGPGLYLFGVIALVQGFKHWRDTGVWLCLSFAVPVLLLFGMGAGHEMSLPHWTAMAWAGLAPLTARWLLHNWRARWVRVGVRAALLYSLVVIVCVFSEFISPWMPFTDNNNPLRDLYGWQQAAQRAEQLRQQMTVAEGEGAPVLFTENWTYASRLAWYARPAAVQVTDTRYDQFDIWFGSPQNAAKGILMLWPNAEEIPATGGAGEFSNCDLRERLPIRSHGHLVSTFSFYACYGFRK